MNFQLDSQKSRIANMHLPFWDKLNRSQVKQCRCMLKGYLHWLRKLFWGNREVLVQQRAKWLVSLLMDFVMTFLRWRLCVIIQISFKELLLQQWMNKTCVGGLNMHSTSNPTIKEEEPMEIGHVRPTKCYKCHKLGHIAKHYRSSHQSKPCKHCIWTTAQGGL